LISKGDINMSNVQFLSKDIVKVGSFTFDFSNINLTNEEGVKLEFNSWEEMEAYMDAYNEVRCKAGLL
jgi:hypothetical protein